MTGEPRVVVCAVDGSNVDGNAIEVAAQLAVLADARLALVAVAPLPLSGAPEPGPRAPTLEERRRALQLTASALGRRVRVDCYLEVGNPVRQLVEFAAQTRALLLVIGAPAANPALPASIVASGVTRSAPCPVVVVPYGTPVPELESRR